MRLIDADALEKEFCSGCQYENNKYSNCIDCALAQAPTIEERKTGKWNAIHEITPLSNPDSITYVCSECGDKHYTLYCLKFDMKYCPNCGAKMEVK